MTTHLITTKYQHEFGSRWILAKEDNCIVVADSQDYIDRLSDWLLENGITHEVIPENRRNHIKPRIMIKGDLEAVLSEIQDKRPEGTTMKDVLGLEPLTVAARKR